MKLSRDPDEQEFLKVYELRKAYDDPFSPYSAGTDSEVERQQRRDAAKELNEAIKQTLGDERYAEYERAKDWNFQQTYQAVKRADLGKTEAIQVYDMKRSAEAEARNLRGNKELTRIFHTHLRGMARTAVAQVSNLLCRRLPCRQGVRNFPRSAGWKPATQQAGSLRYGKRYEISGLTREQRNAALAGIQAETERSIKGVLGDKGWEQYNRGHNTYWLNNMVPKPRPQVQE